MRGDRRGRADRQGAVGRTRILEIFEDHRAFENRRVSDLENRRLPERRDRKEPIRFGGEIDVDAREGQRFFGERDRHALHVGAEFMADQRELR